MRAVLRRIALAVLVILVAGFAVVLVARAFGWQSGPLYFLVALTPYVGLGCLVVALLAGLLRAWWVLGSALAGAALVAYWWIPAFRPAPVASDATELTVMTTNMEFGRADPAQIVRAARDHGVDLLSVQELTPQGAARLSDEGIGDILPYRYLEPADAASGTGMWSAYPLSDKRELAGVTFMSLMASVHLPGGDTSFVAAHPRAPAPLDGNDSAANFERLDDVLADTPGPVIVAGDFNATRDHRAIRYLETVGYVDAASAAGYGLPRTWPNDLRPIPPAVGIDHVLTRAVPLVARQVSLVDIADTDHLTLIAQF